MKTIAELKAVRDEVKIKVDMRENKDIKKKILVGMATHGIAAGARSIVNKFLNEVVVNKVEGVIVTQIGNIEENGLEPIVQIEDEKGITTYCKVTEEMVVEIVQNHIINNKVIDKYIMSK